MLLSLLPLIPFDVAQMYFTDLISSDDTDTNSHEHQVRALWVLLISVCMLRRIKQKSPTLFNTINTWMNVHAHHTAADLFGLNKQQSECKLQ